MENPNEKQIIDHIDKTILSFLMRDARATFQEIAKECGLSSAAIHQRVRKLEDNGILESSRYIVNPKSLGFQICAFVGVHLDKACMYKNVTQRLRKISEVVEGHYITGPYSLLLKLYCRDNQHLMDVVVDRIQNIEGIQRTETYISLMEAIERPLFVERPDNSQKAETKNDENISL